MCGQSGKSEISSQRTYCHGAQEKSESVLVILDIITPYGVVWIKMRSFMVESGRTVTFKTDKGELSMLTEKNCSER